MKKSLLFAAALLMTGMLWAQSEIPESVTKVGWLAFARCGIEQITLPASQSEWNESDAAFQECMNLENLTLITSYIENPAGVLENLAAQTDLTNTVVDNHIF